MAVMLITEFGYKPEATEGGCGCSLHIASLMGNEELVGYLYGNQSLLF